MIPDWALTAAVGIIASIGGWFMKRVTNKLENTYSKKEVRNIIELELKAVKSDLKHLHSNDIKIEAGLVRMEAKIDKIINIFLQKKH